MAGVNPLLILTVAMFGFLFAVAVGILTFRDWKGYRPTLTTEEEDLMPKLLSHPATWVIGFLGGTLLLAGTAMLMVAGPASMQGTLLLGVAAVIGILLAFLVFTGVWDLIKTQGRSNSEAVGIGAIVVALLFVLMIAAQLVLG